MGGLPASSEVGAAGKRTGRRRRVEGGLRRLQGCSESSASLSCCSGGLRPNSGEVGCNRRGEEVEEVQEGEENSLVCRIRPRSVGFYSGRGRAARHGLVDHGDDGTVAERSGRRCCSLPYVTGITTRLKALKTRVCGEQERDARALYRGGQSSMVTTATVLERGDGVVWELTGAVAMLRAEAEVRGEVEATRRRRALACSGASPCASCRAWALLGASVHVSFWPVAMSTWSRACRGSFRRVRGSRLTR
jgi:hypothetical protein